MEDAVEFDVRAYARVMKGSLETKFSAHKLPMIQQSERAECGLACLAMVANYHGHAFDLLGLRQRFSLSASGARLSDLIQIAEELDFEARALRVEMDALYHLEVPAVLHWDLNHFVVLRAVRKNRVIIHDPAKGVRTLSLDEASRHFTGVVLELLPAPGFLPQTAIQPTRLADVWGKVRHARSAVAQVLGLSLLVQALALVAPLFLQIVIDQVVSAENSSLLFALTATFAGVFLLSAFSTAVRAWSILYFGNIINYQMVANVFTRLIRLNSDYFEKRHVGDILSRMTSARSIQTTITDTFASSIIDAFFAIIIIVVIFLYSVVAGWVIIVTTTILVLLNIFVTVALRARQEEMISASANEQTHMMESVRAAPTIKLYGREADRVSRWRSLYSGVVNATLRVGKLQIILKFAEEVVMAFQLLAVMFIAASAVIAGEMTIGMLAALLSYRQTLGGHLGGLLTHTIQFRLIKVHLDRLGDIVHSEVDPSAMPQRAARPTLHDNSIQLSGVSFRYGSNAPMVLDDVDLDIPDRAFVAIVGPSGSGKSTIMRLILGLLEPEKGSVMVGRRHLTGDNKRAWRKQLGVVLQSDKLFTGTLTENISFFDPKATDQRVKAAAISAEIHDHIADMPMGYMSLIGDMGSALSGGQHQRLLLARALYRIPSVLLLDEGTANLDPETEAAIVRTIKSLDATRIVVAHRPALVEAADIVFEMRDRKIVRLR